MASINHQLILDEEYDENYQPTQEEIFDYAQVIGIDPYKGKELLFIARQGIVTPLPAAWKPCQDPSSGDIYYFNFSTGASVWEHPCDGNFREKVLWERELMKNKQKKKKTTEEKSNAKEKESDKKAVKPLSNENDDGLVGRLTPVRGELGPLVPLIYPFGKENNGLFTDKSVTEDNAEIESYDYINHDDVTDLDLGINSAIATGMETMDIDSLDFSDDSYGSELKYEEDIQLLKEKYLRDYEMERERIINENKVKLESIAEELKNNYEEQLKQIQMKLESEYKNLKITLEQEGSKRTEKLKQKLEEDMDRLLSDSYKEHNKQRMKILCKEKEFEEQLFADSLEESKLKSNLEMVLLKEEENMAKISRLKEAHYNEIKGLQEKHKAELENLKKQFKTERIKVAPKDENRSVSEMKS